MLGRGRSLPGWRHGDNRGLDAADPTIAALAERTHAARVAFATNGDPGRPRCTAAHPAVPRIGARWSVTGAADGPERALWAGIR
jgi:para-nitrobenzyl esterase